MKLVRTLIPLLLTVSALAGAEGLRKEGGETFLEPLQKRDSILVADQLRYGFALEISRREHPWSFPS